MAAQVLEMRERALGPEHPEVAAALNNLAVLLRSVDKVLCTWSGSTACQGPDCWR